MKNFTLSIITIAIAIIAAQTANCQTSIQGNVLSVDGSTIPMAVISIIPENTRDIFSGHYEDVYAGKDGSYQLDLHDPGIYRITFRAVYHKSVTIPVLVYDQPPIDMNVLLLPAIYNDGFYFDDPEYLSWIRVVGNFNNYDFNSGKGFSLNNDGSISAFIPVKSDTVRYQVRGLNYGHGATPLPLADEYNKRDDGSLESVLINRLPADSLEIRYTPGKTIPFQRHLFEGLKPLYNSANGFIAFRNPLDQYWTEPLKPYHSFQIFSQVIDWSLATGLPAEIEEKLQPVQQENPMQRNAGNIVEFFLEALEEPDLHPQQVSILLLAYAGSLYWLDRIQNARFQIFGMEKGDEVLPDSEIILTIPDKVSPVHPAWSRNIGLPEFLLKITDNHPQLVAYFKDVAKHHPDEQVVRSAVFTLLRHSAPDYSTIEEMDIYRIIVERYGEGNLARRAHREFENIHSEILDK